MMVDCCIVDWRCCWWPPLLFVVTDIVVIVLTNGRTGRYWPVEYCIVEILLLLRYDRPRLTWLPVIWWLVTLLCWWWWFVVGADLVTTGIGGGIVMRSQLVDAGYWPCRWLLLCLVTCDLTLLIVGWWWRALLWPVVDGYLVVDPPGWLHLLVNLNLRLLLRLLNVPDCGGQLIGVIVYCYWWPHCYDCWWLICWLLTLLI